MLNYNVVLTRSGNSINNFHFRRIVNRGGAAGYYTLIKFEITKRARHLYPPTTDIRHVSRDDNKYERIIVRVRVARIINS